MNNSVINIMKKCALHSLNNSFTHVASLIRGNSIICMGTNCLRCSSPHNSNGKSTKCSFHAETNVLRKLASHKGTKNNSSFELVVIRVSPRQFKAVFSMHLSND